MEEFQTIKTGGHRRVGEILATLMDRVNALPGQVFADMQNLA
jgi:hypothetical protein